MLLTIFSQIEFINVDEYALFIAHAYHPRALDVSWVGIGVVW